ncbi:MAG: TetR/AcrR family transcriptional regulator [Pseudomonadota bacterium]
MSSPQEKQGYHHGDLKRSLIDAGLDLVREVGIEAISLRQLAERVGVSTPALYHHFRNKEALLGQLGEAAIDAFDVAMETAMRNTEDDALSAFVLGYVRFARDEPALYELLFGRRMWSSSEAADFQRKARHSFRLQSERLLQLQQLGVLPAHANPLRLAQVAWATLHGLCCMYNDGLAFTAEAIEDIAKHAIALLRQAVLSAPPAHTN